MRGIPGSGKTTRAKELALPENICSADDYFVDKETGEYKFQAHELGKAHQACLLKFVDLVHSYRRRELMTCGYEEFDVVVDNTNLRKWEFDIYVKIAEIADMDVKFEEFVPPRDTTIGEYVRTCAERNTHGVSPNACLRMASIYEVIK